jgi:hypothetical protein
MVMRLEMDRLQQQREIDFHLQAAYHKTAASQSVGGAERDRTSARETDKSASLEDLLQKYTDWQLSRVTTDLFRDNTRKARDLSLEHGYDINQIREMSAEFFIKRGVTQGVALRFFRDIPAWLKKKGRS